MRCTTAAESIIGLLLVVFNFQLSDQQVSSKNGAPAFSVAFRGISWNSAERRCERLGQRLCFQKDLCRPNTVPVADITVPPIDSWIPIADQHNEWLRMGPQANGRCEKISKTEGPPYWQTRGCLLLNIRPKDSVMKREFCKTAKGYYCCSNQTAKEKANPRPTSVYIFSRRDRDGPYYLFSLKKDRPENSWSIDNAPWRKGGELNGDLSMITLMSGYVKNHFEDPVYFCTKRSRTSDGSPTTLHKVSRTWCPESWTLSFFLYGNLSKSDDEQSQKYIIGVSTSRNAHSRISLDENQLFPEDFHVYGPYDSTNRYKFIKNANKVQKSCNGKPDVFTSRTGFISSPIYRGKRDFRCVWRIKASARSVIKISFKSLRLPAPQPRISPPLQFRSFKGKRTATHNFNQICLSDRVDITNYGRFCGNIVPPVFYTVSNFAEIIFSGRSNNPGSRFTIFYEVVDPRHGLSEIKGLDSPERPFTWDSAEQKCIEVGKTMCKSEDICISKSRPFYGVKNGDQWAPVSDKYNEWIQIGRGNIPTCQLRSQVLGPPEWGTDEQICATANMSAPCPLRKFAYCCNYAETSLKAPKKVTVVVYSVVRNGMIFYKYVRNNIDRATSFDSSSIWSSRRRRRGDATSFVLQEEKIDQYDTVVYFCSMTVIPAQAEISKAYALSLQPCEERGWEFLYHLYGMDGPKTDNALKLYVGFHEKWPYYTRVNLIEFWKGFRGVRSFIVYAERANEVNDPKLTTDDESAEPCPDKISELFAPSILESAGYPESYASNANCRWLITKPTDKSDEGSRMKVTIEELNLEDPVDVLTIQEISSPVVQSKNNKEFNFTFVSQRDFTGTVSQVSVMTQYPLLLTFKTDGSISKKGFRIKVELIDDECGGIIQNDGQVITNPGFPFPYKGSYDCSWAVTAPSDYKIEIEFLHFDLIPESNCSDRLEIILQNDRELLYCGGAIPPTKAISEFNTLQINFIAAEQDSLGTIKRGKGFSLKLKFVHDETSIFQQPTAPQCGVQSVPFGNGDQASERIVNGNVAENGNFPWMVMVGRPQVTCGGTLINSRFVLSATHCFVSHYIASIQMMIMRADLEDFRIIAGRYNRNYRSPGEQIFNITDLIIHGRFQRFSTTRIQRGITIVEVFPYNDIALVKLDRNAIFSSTVSPACLPTQDAHVGDFCYVAGWGSLSADGSVTASEINYARVPILDNSLCNNWEEMKGTIMENVICAGFVRGGGDHCWGDSGGSLVCRGRYGNFYVNGIVSWSRECGGTRTPGVYTRVWNFVDWIERAMKQTNG